MKCDAVQYNLNLARGNSDASPSCIATLAGFFIGDTMKNIQLTQGKFAIVDDADYEWLSKFKWCAVKDRYTFYAVRSIRLPNGKQQKIRMHREILGLKCGDKRQGDHRNHNGLHNWRDNLRICTNTENQYNQRPQKDRSSQFKGVSWHKSHLKWEANIMINGKNLYLGNYVSEIEAAHVYDAAAIKYYGEFANLNIPEGKAVFARFRTGGGN